MNILFIGGTSFTGPFAIRHLVDAGHAVTVFHRGKSKASILPEGVRHIIGDKDRLTEARAEFRAIRPDVVVNMMCLTTTDAEVFVDVFGDMAGRAVVISSADVYRNYGRLHGTEPGPPDPLPLDEDAPLREKLSEQGEHYNKTSVESIVRKAPFPVTILRYSAIYGPEDPLNRTFDTVKRVDDGRRHILVQDGVDTWRFHDCYCENAGHALALATVRPEAAGRVYNVADLKCPTVAERIHQIARAAGWDGSIVTLKRDQLPEAMRFPGDLSASLVLDTQRIRRELGYQEIVSYDEGLRRTIEWQRANPPEYTDAEFDYAAEDAALMKAGIAV